MIIAHTEGTLYIILNLSNLNSQLESDMLVLRGLLNELSNVSDNLRDDGSESGPGNKICDFFFF